MNRCDPISSNEPELAIATKADRLALADWEQIRIRLMAHLLSRALIYGLRLGPADALAPGLSAQDLVSIAVEKVLRGQRRWLQSTQQDLLVFLKGVVNSDLDHLMRPGRRYREISLEVNLDGVAGPCRFGSSGNGRSWCSVAPAALPKNGAKNGHAASRIAALREAVGAHPELLVIVDAILSGVDPRPRILAQHLGLPVAEIYRRLKRLRRRTSANGISSKKPLAPKAPPCASTAPPLA